MSYFAFGVPLHHHVLHLERRQEANNERDGIHLKNMVMKFSIEIVMLWGEFSSNLDEELKKQLDTVLENVLIEAETIRPSIRSLIKDSLKS